MCSSAVKPCPVQFGHHVTCSASLCGTGVAGCCCLRLWRVLSVAVVMGVSPLSGFAAPVGSSCIELAAGEGASERRTLVQRSCRQGPMGTQALTLYAAVAPKEPSRFESGIRRDRAAGQGRRTVEDHGRPQASGTTLARVRVRDHGGCGYGDHGFEHPWPASGVWSPGPLAVESRTADLACCGGRAGRR